MTKFYKLKVSEVRRETPECVSLKFDIPESLQNEYKYIQGQYITLKLNIDGKEVRRCYSLCSAPHENEFRVAVKKMKGGFASKYINEYLSAGDQIEVMTPMGNFYTTLNQENRINYLFFAGGSGITPIFSIIKSVLHTEPLSTVKLFYGNINENNTIFGRNLIELRGKYSDRLDLYFIYEKPDKQIDEIFRGIMTPEKIRTLLNKYSKKGAKGEYFICGPTSMMENVKKTLETLSVPQENIHLEYFTPEEHTEEEKKVILTTKKIESKVTIILWGMETSFYLPSDGPSILETALKHNVDAPYGCQNSVCASCKAIIIEGKVHMDKNNVLTDEEVKNGYILTCQSHPLTPEVKVTYDI